MFISQGSLLDQTNLSQQTSALSGFCAHINAICFSMSPQSCSSTRLPTYCTSVKTCSPFSSGRGSTLRTPCRWRFSSSLLAQEQRQNIFWVYVWFPRRLYDIVLHTDEILSLTSMFNCQGAYYMPLPVYFLLKNTDKAQCLISREIIISIRHCQCLISRELISAFSSHSSLQSTDPEVLLIDKDNPLKSISGGTWRSKIVF